MIKSEEEFRSTISDIITYGKVHDVSMILGVFLDNEADVAPYHTGDLLERNIILGVLQETHSINMESEIEMLRKDRDLLLSMN